MVDTVRTLSALQTLLADNTTGAISPQDLRDMLVSTYTTWDTFTPVWGGASTDPTIGNGTLEGWYRSLDIWVEGRIRVLMGSTTTFGTGSWYYWDLPTADALASPIQNSGTAHFGDSGTATRVGVAAVYEGGIFESTDALYCYESGTTDLVRPTTPHTWADGDLLEFDFRYRIT